MSLWLLGVFPLAVIRIRNIQDMRKSDRGEFFTGGFLRWILFWKYWIWPCNPRDGRGPTGIYRLKFRSGLRIFVKLNASVHYRLRDAIHDAQHERKQQRASGSMKVV